MLRRSRLCDYSNAYKLVSATIRVLNKGAAGAAENNRKNKVIKNYAPFTNCISNINNTQTDSAKDFDIVISMYNLIEYSANYCKTSGRLWHYYRDEPLLGNVANNNDNDNNSASFKFKTKIADRTGNDGTKNVKIRVPLKDLSNFWITLEMSLINCQINLILTWFNTCFMTDNTIVAQQSTLTITDIKRYVPVVSFSPQDNVKLLEQLKSGFKTTINWNKYKPKVITAVIKNYKSMNIKNKK